MVWGWPAEEREKKERAEKEKEEKIHISQVGQILSLLVFSLAVGIT